MKQDGSSFRAMLNLSATNVDAKFQVYIRQHTTFDQNFSIGLNYIGSLGTVQLIRFNGPNKTKLDSIEDHHYYPHFHIEIGEEGSQNKLNHIEITDEYDDLKSALIHAVEKLNIVNCLTYFPEIDQTEIPLGDL